MSVQSEIDRINTATQDSLVAVSSLGGEVPVGAKIADLPIAINSIPVNIERVSFNDNATLNLEDGKIYYGNIITNLNIIVPEGYVNNFGISLISFTAGASITVTIKDYTAVPLIIEGDEFTASKYTEISCFSDKPIVKVFG